MNSWHLSLTILAVCTVSPLAAAQNIEMKAQADIVSPDGKVNGTIKFVQELGSVPIDYNFEISGLVNEAYSLNVYEKAGTGNNCRNMGGVFNPTNATLYIDRFGFIYAFTSYLDGSLLSKNGSDSGISLTGVHNIIGRGIGVTINGTFEPVACGVIYTTNDTVTRTISTTSAPSTAITSSTRRTISHPCTTRTTVPQCRKIQPVYGHCYTPEAQIICPSYYLHRQQQYPHSRALPYYPVMTD